MSRAFVSEAAEEARAAALPERPVSPHANFVTPRGLALIEAELAALQSALGTADDGTRPRLSRDLRYWRARRTSAQLVEPRQVAPDEVVFGAMVAIQRGAAASRFRIVGEDEADPTRALLSWTSPLATALLGAGVGDVVEIGGGRDPATVTAIEA